MAKRVSTYLSEDDIRTKVVYEWLKSCGISDSELAVEFSITLRLGKGTRTMLSRSDVLVKNPSGNLLIVEVKQPRHHLCLADKLQGLAYARSLADGGIAPFTIITNGKETEIYDSVTGELISGQSIPSDHPYIINGFKVTGDALTTRAEALDYLISLNDENLIAFCKGQVSEKMELLKSIDPFSGKKYIPGLQVTRKAARKELDKKIKDCENTGNVILVTGPPQHGKTCFMCQTVDDLLDKNIPCLFYPAISLRTGLLKEIADDFEWSFGEALMPVHVVNRISRLMLNAGSAIFLVIDGWNEMADMAISLNDEIARLSGKNIRIILSTTSPSLPRLIKDGADNLTHIGRLTGLTPLMIKRLSGELLADTAKLNIVQIGKFDDEEMSLGKSVYEHTYNVKFPEQYNLPNDPFYLRLAAEQYTGKDIPSFATEAGLIRESLLRKGRRNNIGELELLSGLKNLGQLMVLNGAPVDVLELPDSLLDDNVISKWRECAILSQTWQTDTLYVDFYYTHDKDYAIGILSRQWHQKLLRANVSEINAELELACKTEAGNSALEWFLSCPENVETLKYVVTSVKDHLDKNSAIFELLLNAIRNQDFKDLVWLREILGDSSINALIIYVHQVIKHSDIDTRTFCTWLKILISTDQTLDFDTNSMRENFQISRSNELIDLFLMKYTGKKHLDLLHDIIPETHEFVHSHNPLIKQIHDYLTQLIYDAERTIAFRSANLLSNISPRDFFKNTATIYREGKITKLNLRTIHRAMHNCLEYLHTDYYGKCMTPGLFYDPLNYDSEEDDDKQEAYDYTDLPEIIKEYEEMKSSFIALLDLFKDVKCVFPELNNLWTDLVGYVSYAEIEELEDEANNEFFSDPKQLRLKFN